MRELTAEARRIKAAREDRNWSQARLAREANVSENTVLNMENGRRTQAAKLEAMRNALDLAEMDRSIDTRDVPDDVLLFLRHAAARISAMPESQRTRLLADLYPRIIGDPKADRGDIEAGTAAYRRGRAAGAPSTSPPRPGSESPVAPGSQAR